MFCPVCCNSRRASWPLDCVINIALDRLGLPWEQRANRWPGHQSVVWTHYGFPVSHIPACCSLSVITFWASWERCGRRVSRWLCLRFPHSSLSPRWLSLGPPPHVTLAYDFIVCRVWLKVKTHSARTGCHCGYHEWFIDYNNPHSHLQPMLTLVLSLLFLTFHKQPRKLLKSCFCVWSLEHLFRPTMCHFPLYSLTTSSMPIQQRRDHLHCNPDKKDTCKD